MRKLELEDVSDDVIQHVIAPLLVSKSCAALAGTSTLFNKILQADLNTRKLLGHVDLGEEDQVIEMMMTRNPRSLFTKLPFTDHCGRVFKKVSPWQLMLWSLDRQMWDRVLTVGKEKFDDDLNRLALKQRLALNDKKLTYRLDGKTITESHFNFQPTLDAYKVFLKISQDRPLDLDAADKLWCGENNSVGMHQRLWPAWTLQLISVHSNLGYRMPYECTVRGSAVGLLPLRPGHGFGFQFALADGGRGWGMTRSARPSDKGGWWLRVGDGVGKVRSDALAIDKICRAREQQFSQLTSTLKEGLPPEDVGNTASLGL